ncbi:MAG: hypothetical protein M1817_006727 [Caeruleum heppii]|nr:MAG: hypothetical protein M1817_006727 [Caeruleum heppii]
MRQSNVASSMQKTYDECYLSCSTANNERDALRSWRSALDQIYYHNAYRVPPHYRPKSQTEKALQDSLRDMEKQCKERVDLLEALRQSRTDAAKSSTDGSSDSHASGHAAFVRTPRVSAEHDQGYIGQGTVPAINMPDLPRSGPPLPQRPAVPSKTNSSIDTVRAASGPPISLTASRPTTSPSLPIPYKPTSRSPSPEKKGGLRSTLRTGKDGKRPARSPRPSGGKKQGAVAASKAATQAWGTLPSERDGLGRSHRDLGSSTTVNSYFDRPDSQASGQRKFSTQENHGLSSPSPHLSSSRGQDGGRDGARTPSGLYQTFSNGPDASDSRRPSTTHDPLQTSAHQPSKSVDDLITLDLPDIPPRPAEASLAAPTKREPSPPRTETKYQWPVYQSRQTSSQEKKHPPPPPKPLSRASKPATQSTLPTRQRSPPRKTHTSDKKATGVSRRPVANSSTPRTQPPQRSRKMRDSPSSEEDTSSSKDAEARRRGVARKERKDPRPAETPRTPDSDTFDASHSESDESSIAPEVKAWNDRVASLMRHLPKGVDQTAAEQIFNEIVIKGDEVHWDDVAGLEIAKSALKEAVVYPFLRPDLFMGLREPARGMLLFGPPGTGKTMLARAVATESKSTFFSISASSLTSKYLGESEKLVRALFGLAKALAPSIIFVDEIDSLLSSRGGGGEHEATRRIKTEFLIQWSDLARAAAGREQSRAERDKGDASRVLVLAATNLPWAIDEAARRRFVRRQYIPLPEGEVRAKQLRTLLGHQKHVLDEADIARLVALTDGFSGSDITALAKDAAMGPLRSLGEALLHMSSDQIRPIQLADFETSLVNIRPSVSKEGLGRFEAWSREFGERGG